MYSLLNMVIFQPAMLVYQRVVYQNQLRIIKTNVRVQTLSFCKENSWSVFFLYKLTRVKDPNPCGVSWRDPSPGPGSGSDPRGNPPKWVSMKRGPRILSLCTWMLARGRRRFAWSPSFFEKLFATLDWISSWEFISHHLITRLQICARKNIFGNTPPQMVYLWLDLNIGESTRAWRLDFFRAKSTTLDKWISTFVFLTCDNIGGARMRATDWSRIFRS